LGVPIRARVWAGDQRLNSCDQPCIYLNIYGV